MIPSKRYLYLRDSTSLYYILDTWTDRVISAGLTLTEAQDKVAELRSAS